jgi:hypothetical protein
MQALAKNKIILSLLVLFILAMFVYNVFIKSDESVSTNEEFSLSVGSDLLKLSEALSKAHLDQDLFSVPGYIYLTDFTAPIPEQSIGRVNPFDTIGRD